MQACHLKRQKKWILFPRVINKDIHPGGQDPLSSQMTNNNDDEWIRSNGDCLPLPTHLVINMRWIIKSLAHYFLRALVNSLSN